MTPGAAPLAAGETEPIPVVDGRQSWGDVFSVLRAFNYRLYVTSQIFATTGGWMQRIAIDWLVLELTGNVALVGLTVTLQFAPVILLGAWAGVLSDRHRRRVILITTQTAAVIVNAVLAALVLLGVAAVWHVFIAAALLGVATAIDGPARAAFIAEMVGTRRLGKAISLNASVFHLGGLVGPAISGVMIVLIGSGWSIAVNALTSAVAVTALALMRVRELIPARRPPAGRGQIREAIRYVVRKPSIFWPLILLAFVSVFGMNLPVLLAASADETYATGAAGYGLYCSLAALGAFAGALLSSARRSLSLRKIILCAVIFGLVTALAGLAPWYGLFLACLVGLGMARLLFATAAESMTQFSTNLAIRGRVMSFYIMVLLGGQAIGGVLVGWIAEHAGASVAFVVAGGVPALAAVVVGLVLAHVRRLRVRVDFRNPRAPLRLVPRGLDGAG